MENEDQGKQLTGARRAPSEFFRVKLDETELNVQIEQYATLGWTKSVRKIATLLLLFSLAVTLLLVPLSQNYADALVIALLSLYIYRGSRFAIVLSAIYWTLAKGDQLLSLQGQPVTIFFWWFLYIRAFAQAYQVEVQRRLRSESVPGPVALPRP